jgi:3-isopropylmalate/(R)-2-methylmalate dehydratase small subunit
VPVQLDREIVTGLLEQLKASARPEITVDLERLELALPGGARHLFALDPFWRECLLKGVDEIDLTLGYLDRIEAFERAYHGEMAWLGTQPVASQ